MRVACIGECMVELSERPDGSLVRGFGGDTLNTALYLARLGVAVDYVTALGDDVWSDEMAAAWAREGIGLGQVRRLPGRMPGLYIIRTDPAGERSFHYWRERAAARDLFAGPGAAGTGPPSRPTTSSTSRASASRSTARAGGPPWRRPWRRCAPGAGGSPSTPITAPAAGPTGTRPGPPSGPPWRMADLIFASVEDLDWLFGAAGEDGGSAPPRPGRDRAQGLGRAGARRPGAARGGRDRRAGRAGGAGRRHDGRGGQLRGGLPRRAPRRSGAGGRRRRGASPRRGGDRASRCRDPRAAMPDLALRAPASDA